MCFCMNTTWPLVRAISMVIVAAVIAFALLCAVEYVETYEERRAPLDALTRVCSDLRMTIRRHNPELLRELTEETRQWIAKHDEEDRARIEAERKSGEREQVRLDALKKLTLEERRALGL